MTDGVPSRSTGPGMPGPMDTSNEPGEIPAPEYARLAAACVEANDIEGAVVYFLRAAHTEGPMRWEDLVQKPVIRDGFPCLSAVEPEATGELLTEAITALGDNRFALIAYVRSLLRHIEFVEEFAETDPTPNTFSCLQIVGAFRSLAALLEIRLRQVTGSAALFYDVIQAAYRKNLAVWARFEAEKNHCGMSGRSETPYATRLRYALSPFSPPASRRERFAQSLLIAYIVRNYATHEMDLHGPLVEPASARTILGHLLNVFTYCDAEKSL